MVVVPMRGEHDIVIVEGGCWVHGARTNTNIHTHRHRHTGERGFRTNRLAGGQAGETRGRLQSISEGNTNACGNESIIP